MKKSDIIIWFLLSFEHFAYQYLRVQGTLHEFFKVYNMNSGSHMKKKKKKEKANFFFVL